MIRVIIIVEKVMVEETMVIVMLEKVMVEETMVIVMLEKVMVEETTVVVMLEMVMMVEMVIMKTLWNCMKRVYLNTVPARHPYYSLHPPYFQT